MLATFTTTDYAILAGYVVASVALGLWFGRGQRSVEGYYLAGRSAPWWAVAISIISSDTTAISYLGCAAIVFTGDLQFLLGTLAATLAAVFVSYVFVPLLAEHKVFTAYQYLEHRFSPAVRTFASALFVLMRASHLSVALYASALVLAAVLGVSLWTSLLVIGCATTLYTVYGGIKAAIWTDVIQFSVLIGGLVAVLVGVSLAFHWDLAHIWRVASHPVPADAPWLHAPEHAGHTRLANFRFNLTDMNFWVIMLSLFLQSVGAYGSDQVLVQRYLTTGSRREMAKSLVGGGLILLPVNTLMYFTGVFLVAYYATFLHAPAHGWVGQLTDPNGVMAHFITHGLPGVLSAVVIAGLFAGTMSSFAAGLNSLSTTTYVDFVTRFGYRPKTGGRGLVLAKAITCGWGVVIVLTAITIGGRETIFALLAKVMSPFSGPLVGVFLLGMISRRANTFGALSGALIGVVATLFVTYCTPLHWLWYFVVGSMGGLTAGYLLSFLKPGSAAQPGNGWSSEVMRELPQDEGATG